MFKKFMLCVFLCLPFSIQFTYCMEIEEESIQEKQELLKQSAEQVPFKWQEINVQKSFVFRTEENKIFILLKGTYAHKLYLLSENNTKPEEIASSANTYWPDIEHYVPVVYGTTKDGYYFYAAIKEKATLLKKEQYAVVKINITCDLINNPKPIIKTLFDHNSPIMHLGMITNNTKKYLVSGSFYPSIKIYDIKKEKVIKRLHNRFLLGTTDDSLIYAKKTDPRPYFNLGRKLAYDLGKQYNCNILILLPFNNNVEMPINKENITIEFAQYPLIINTDPLIMFNRKNNTITNLRDTKIMSNLSQFSRQIKRGRQIPPANVNADKLIKLLTDKDLELYFKESMTDKSFTDFHFNDQTKKVADYLNFIITNIIINIIDPTSKNYEFIKNRIIYNYFGKVNKNSSLKINDMSFDEKSLRILTDAAFNAFNLTYRLSATDDKLINNLILYEPQYSIDAIQNVYMSELNIKGSNNFIIIQTKNKIFTGIISTNDIYFEECYTTEDAIHNSYVVDNTLFVITKNGFYKTDLSNQLTIS